MLDHLAREHLWRTIPADLQLSLMETVPSVAVERVVLASRSFTDDVVRALLREYSPEAAERARPVLVRMGDNLLPLLLEPAADPQWCGDLAGAAMSSEAGTRTTVGWILDRDTPLETEGDLTKAADLLYYTVPTSVVPEGRVEEFLRKAGPSGAVQQLARAWPDVPDEVVWDILTGPAAAAATEALGKEWYRAAGQSHIPVVLSYRRALYDKALQQEEFAPFCPHALWWEDAHADSLPGINWEDRTCSPNADVARTLLALTWCPATTPDRAEAILEMAAEHAGTSTLWGRTHGAAQGRVRQGRPAIDLTEIDDREMLSKMLTRITKKRWPERFAEAVLINRNENLHRQFHWVGRELDAHLRHTILGSELWDGKARGTSSTITTATLIDSRRPDAERVAYDEWMWRPAAALPHEGQLRFWSLLNSLVAGPDAELPALIETAVELVT